MWHENDKNEKMSNERSEGVCVSSVIGCGCHVFESQLILLNTLAHIQIYSPISENFIIFQDTFLDVEEEFISS